MNVYLDSSAILRVVLGQPGSLAEWAEIRHPVTSALAEVECLRTIDRLRVQSALDDETSVAARETIYRVLETAEVVELSPAVMRQASRTMPVPLATLDAIHLATAELWRQERNMELLLASHDRALALAARASGFRLLG